MKKSYGKNPKRFLRPLIVENLNEGKPSLIMEFAPETLSTACKSVGEITP